MDNGTGGQHVAPVVSGVGPAASMPLDARTIKALIFSEKNKQFKREKITFFGQELEIVQPTLARMTDISSAADTGENQGIHILMHYAYVPGTNQLAFDAADRESLESMPWGDDFYNAVKTFNRITGASVPEATKNSKPNPSASK